MALTMTQKQLQEYRQENRTVDGGGDDRFRVELPWPIIQFEPQVRSYTKKDGEQVTVRDQRIYRFFSTVEIVRHTNDRTGFTWSDIQFDAPYWSSLMVLGLYSGLAPVGHSKMPQGLYTIPVDDAISSPVDPLAWAVNPPSSPAQRRAARMDATKGMRPQLVFWASALVDEPTDDGGLNRYLAVVQMRKNQAEKMSDKWQAFVNMARIKGDEAKMDGIPVHAWAIKAEKSSDLDLRRADGDRINLIDEYETPDHGMLAEAIRSELDRYLVENGTPILGFPNFGDHAEDGWSSAAPACMADEKPKAKEFEGGMGEFTDEPTHYTALSNRDLIELLQSKGQKVPRNASRERLISMAEDIEDQLVG